MNCTSLQNLHILHLPGAFRSLPYNKASLLICVCSFTKTDEKNTEMTLNREAERRKETELLGSNALYICV